MLPYRNLYLWTVGTIGAAIVVWGLARIPTYDPIGIFLLLVALAMAAQLTATTLVEEDVTVEVSTAVSMAVISLYGAIAGSLVAACAATSVILYTLYRTWPGWPRAVERVIFNIGMVTTALFLAGSAFQFSQNLLGVETIAGKILPWLLAAIITDQVNLWLLIGLLHLQSKAEPIKIWREHRWAIPINVLVMSVGGGVLASAVERFDLIGIGIFFLPIVLSAYAFRFYANQKKQQMEQLEELVAMRTEDLQQANQELEELHKTKDAFLAVLTHDMRNPLSNIKSYAGVLGKGSLNSEQQMRISKILMHSQESLMEIVNSILEIEQLQSGAPVDLNPIEFDLAYLAKITTESVTAQALEKDITLRYEKDPKPIIVYADRSKIKRVLMNLVSNAMKYTREGGIVSVTSECSETEAIVHVNDTGYGIPAEELPYIFDRFRRAKGHQHLAVGTGLGLAIVKNLVEAHHGEISVTSKENEGSTFTMRLPLTPLIE